jgi:ribosomal-protein-alanine N-acetyltransferase
MKYVFAPMNHEYANDIVSNWHYDDGYSFYDMAADEDDLRMFMDTNNWHSIIKAVLNEDDELVGWASFYTENDEFWLSLGLRPDLTGQGLGEEFVTQCVEYAISHYRLSKHTVRLAVALFNQRAIKVYQRAGFVETNRTIRDTHIGQVDFIEMKKEIAFSCFKASRHQSA